MLIEVSFVISHRLFLIQAAIQKLHVFRVEDTESSALTQTSLKTTVLLCPVGTERSE
jgi:hypothetical protein